MRAFLAYESESMDFEKIVYLDWAATTPLCEEAGEAMAPYLTGGIANLEFGGNANSLHSVGRSAFVAMEQARADISGSLGCRADELFFTSGATEADNAAIFGIVGAVKRAHANAGDSGFVPHVITSSIEHEAVLAPVHLLERMGAQVSILKPNPRGFIDPDQVAQALRPNTVLVSVMLANNEVGSIQPVAQIARLAHEQGAYVHTDAVQALAKIPVNVPELGVDAASFSAHKICGPKGIGALFLSKGTPCDPFMLGGGQESGFRSGTQNVAGMVGFAAAVKAVCPDAVVERESRRLGALRDGLYSRLAKVEGVRASVPCGQGSAEYLPNIVNLIVEGVESETMILRLDRRGIMVSGGSACSSKSLAPNRILTELGVRKDSALCSLRISMGRFTSEQDIELFERHFGEMVEWARS